MHVKMAAARHNQGFHQTASHCPAQLFALVGFCMTQPRFTIKFLKLMVAADSLEAFVRSKNKQVAPE